MAAETVYDSRAVADYLIKKALPGGLDPLQIMKLTYIAHGFTLAMKDKPLLEDDVEAWQYGPVLRRLYRVLPSGSGVITHPIYHDVDFDEGDRSIIDAVYDTYGKLSGLYLSNLTHRNGSPWFKTWQTYGKNAVIPQDLIMSHYKRIIEEFNRATEVGKNYSIPAL